MAQIKSAIEQARETFNKLINLKISRAPVPQSQIRDYSVATLPGGLMLRTTGQEKISTPSKKIQAAQRKEASAGVVNGGTLNTLRDLLLHMAIPANQMGTAANRAFALANYVNKILAPRMPTTPGIGAPALLPPSSTKFFGPSPVGELGRTPAGPAGYRTFLENTEKLQKEMAQRFLSQLLRGERQAAFGALGGLGRAPLT